MSSVHFSSAKLDYLTPQSLLRHLYKVFTFDLDPCSDKSHYENPNVKARYHYTEIEDGLSQEWHGVVFMNPPYGHHIGNWFNKAYEQVWQGKALTVVCLVPARTDTIWWQDCIRGASFVTFIKGRLKFSGHENSAPFPSAIVVFGEISHRQKAYLAYLGWSVPWRIPL